MFSFHQLFAEMPPCASKLRNKTGGKTVCWGVGDPEFQLCSVWIKSSLALLDNNS